MMINDVRITCLRKLEAQQVEHLIHRFRQFLFPSPTTTRNISIIQVPPSLVLVSNFVWGGASSLILQQHMQHGP